MKVKKYGNGKFLLKRRKEVRAIKIIDLINKKVITYTPSLLNKILEDRLDTNIKPLELLKFVLNALFGNYEFYNHEDKGCGEPGHPDYLIRRTSNKIRESIYIEFKNLGDSVRASQIEWIFNNPNKKTLIIQFI